jgi:hypothetical protein
MFYILNILILFVAKIACQSDEYSYGQKALSRQNEIDALRNQVAELSETLTHKLQLLNDLYFANCSCEY